MENALLHVFVSWLMVVLYAPVTISFQSVCTLSHP